MSEMKMPEFNFSQWWEEQTAGIEMPNLSEMWSDFNASDLLPDIDVSGWINETFGEIEMPDISSLLPDFSSLGETISESLSGIPTAASTAFSSISTSASETWSSVQSTWSQLPSFFDGLWSGAGSAASSAGSAIASGINSAIGTIQSAWEGLSSWLSSKISSLASMASSAASSIMGAIGGGVGGKAMAEGGFLTAPQHILAGEAGPEVVIPLSPSKKARARNLLERTLLIVNGASNPTGFSSDERMQNSSSLEETDKLGNLKGYQGVSDNLIEAGDLSPIRDAKLAAQRKSIMNTESLRTFNEGSDRREIIKEYIHNSYEHLINQAHNSNAMNNKFIESQFDELGNLKGYSGMSDNFIQAGDLSPIRDAKIAQQMAELNIPSGFGDGFDLPELPAEGEMPISSDNSSSSSEINIELGSVMPTFQIEGEDNPEAIMNAIKGRIEDVSDMIAGQIAKKVADINGNQSVTA